MVFSYTKAIQEKVNKKILSVFNFFLQKLKTDLLLKFLQSVPPEKFNLNSKFFTEFKLTKKNFENAPKYKWRKNSYKRLGIIMQGPLKVEDDFTFETLKKYAESFKGATIVYSCWKGENKDVLKKIEKLGVITLVMEKPLYSGLLNLNYQKTSTLAGMKLLKSKGCKYVLKTRSDQRINSLDWPDKFVTLLVKYPVKKIEDKTPKERIISLNLGTRRYYPYSISDMLNFGNIDDLMKMWTLPCREDNIMASDLIKKIKVKDIYEFENPEICLTKNYLKNIGVKTENSIKKYHEDLSKYFIIVDNEMINLYWYKYNSDINKKRNDLNYHVVNINFLDWLMYYSGCFEENIFEIERDLYKTIVE